MALKINIPHSKGVIRLVLLVEVEVVAGLDSLLLDYPEVVAVQPA
jgi:hypothetical protein